MSSGGVKLGTRISHIVSQTMIATHSKLLHIKHQLAMKIFSDISDVISDEVHETVGPLLRHFNDNAGDDDHSKALLDFMATRHGQFQAMAGTIAGASGILSSLAQVVNNELSPSVRGLLSTNPHLIPDPATIAELTAKGLVEQGNAVSSIEQNGVDSGWAGALIEGSRSYPTTAEAIDMLRRGIIGQDDFFIYAQRNGITASVANQYLQTSTTPISPADAALALLRGNLQQAEAEKVASEWGITSDSFNVLVNNTGEPPGVEQLLEARRRGFIDDARLVQGILQSRVRDEWIDTLKQLAFAPMSTADAVEAVVQNQLQHDQGAQIANDNGLEAGMFDVLVNTAGSPLSRTEMEQLYNRGLVTEDEVKQALRESRLKNKYNDLAFALHTRLLQPGEVADAVYWGAISHQDGVQKVVELGYSAEDAATIVSSSINRKLQSQRLAVLAAAESMYVDNALSTDDLARVATSMGQNDAEITLIQQTAEFKRSHKLILAGHNAIRSKFIAHHIDRNTASSLLDAMGTPHAQRDDMLQLWQLEVDANTRTLTPAQVVKAVNANLITQEDAMARLQADGYSQIDAALLLEGA